MENTKIDSSANEELNDQEEVKWDYTSREGTLFIGALVVGLNVVVLIAFLLYQYIPSVHTFITGKPI